MLVDVWSVYMLAVYMVAYVGIGWVLCCEQVMQ